MFAYEIHIILDKKTEKKGFFDLKYKKLHFFYFNSTETLPKSTLKYVPLKGDEAV